VRDSVVAVSFVREVAMVSKWCVLASVLFLATPAIAQAADNDPARNAANLATLQKL